MGKSFWHNSGTVNNGYPISTLLTSFISAFSGTSGVAAAGKGSSTVITNAISNSSTDVGNLKYLLDTAKGSTGSVPRAYINWILFDEQFNPVKTGSSFDVVSSTADNVKSHNIGVNIPTGGYLYVYCSNESNFDVFFDNLQLIDTRGPLLETDNYYPFGLAMTGINSQAAGKLENRQKYNGKEIQHKEFSDGGGLEWTDYGARMYDQQIGRWESLDKLSEKYVQFSPYHFSSNNPWRFKEVDGRFFVDAKNNRVDVQVKNGQIILGKNAPADLQRMATLINKSGSGIAIDEFNRVGNNKTMVHFKIDQDNTGAHGLPLDGLHEVHDAKGKVLDYVLDPNDPKKGKFDGEIAFVKGKDGKLAYKEATITLFEKSFYEGEVKGVGFDNGYAGASKEDVMVAIFSHEEIHDTDQDSIDANNTAQKNNTTPNHDFETPAYSVEYQILQEIKKIAADKKPN